MTKFFCHHPMIKDFQMATKIHFLVTVCMATKFFRLWTIRQPKPSFGLEQLLFFIARDYILGCFQLPCIKLKESFPKPFNMPHWKIQLPTIPNFWALDLVSKMFQTLTMVIKFFKHCHKTFGHQPKFIG